MSNHHRIFIVSAPSGTGKTTLNRRLIAAHPEVEMSISYTTRAARTGEVDGVHYHFVGEPEFQKLIHTGQMLEYAEVFGTLYGTARAELNRIEAAGHKALLEIDVQGWRQARVKLSDAYSIFILPPSVAVLWERLERRGTEAKSVRWRRLMTARSEIASGGLYDGFIVNHSLDAAYRELEDIIINGEKPKIGTAQGSALCQALLAEFDQAPWLQQLAKELAEG